MSMSTFTSIPTAGRSCAMSIAANPRRCHPARSVSPEAERRLSAPSGPRLLTGRASPFALQLAPPSGAVVGDDVREHRAEGGRVDNFALAEGHGAGGFVVVAGGDDSFGIRDDRAVVKK